MIRLAFMPSCFVIFSSFKWLTISVTNKLLMFGKLLDEAIYYSTVILEAYKIFFHICFSKVL